jgi:hypothetical protein
MHGWKDRWMDRMKARSRQVRVPGYLQLRGGTSKQAHCSNSGSSLGPTLLVRVEAWSSTLSKKTPCFASPIRGPGKVVDRPILLRSDLGSPQELLYPCDVLWT